MRTAEERGALGKRFHDLSTPANHPELDWENMAPKLPLPAPPAEEPRNKRAVLWWWGSGVLVMLLGIVLWWPVGRDSNAATRRELPINPKTAIALAPKTSEREETLGTTARKGRAKAYSVRAPRASGKTTLNSLSSELKLPVVEEYLVREVVKTIARLPPLVPQPLAHEDQLPEVRVPSSVPVVPPGKKASLVVTVGASAFRSGYTGEIPWLAEERNAPSPSFSLRYERPLSPNWFLSTGVDLRNYRFRTAFENVDTDARLFRPGTVDTIFRNRVTGEERTVFTDTIPGIRTRNFGNDNNVTEIGLPLLLGHRWTTGKHAFSLAAGPRVGLVVSRMGKTVIGTNEVSPVSAAPQFGKSLRWSGRLEVTYAYRFTPSVSLLAGVGGEAAFTDWATSPVFRQRPRIVTGQLGLRFLLR